MSTRLVCGIAVVAIVALAGGGAIAQEKKMMELEKKEDAAPDPSETDAMMKKWLEMATPGSHHDELASLAGRWNVEVTVQMDPSAPPDVTQGQSSVDWVLGGRFLKENFRGTAMGQPFEGLGLTGYDNHARKHTAAWMDTMGTLMMTMEGECTDGGKTLTMSGSYVDPASGEKKTMRSVTTIESKDRHVFKAYEVGADGKEVETMQIVYTRM